ncbi:response regulator receiver protein [Desulfovibrio sp. X2]|uniref:hybrid sensor histidine kinase/response regulator n=1 Tax=Desulfovibrio sp. X2 TaxID=941449 RepID=UPI000358F176|nr:hybrid sensor histidine kinase/response regulator [Desulfovibrio sp. X2]EPR43984.1 response regulator receiver protein [Desulfovibrio sp. X2]
MPCILIVDDDPFVRAAHLRNLQRKGYEVCEVEDGHSAIELMRERPVEAVLLDFMLPGMDGLETFLKMRSVFGEDGPPALMITGQGSMHLAVEFMKAGGADFVEKPVTDYDILDIRLRRAMENARLRRRGKEEEILRKAAEESDHLKDTFIGLVAKELKRPLDDVLSLAEHMAEGIQEGTCPALDEAGRMFGSLLEVSRVVDDILELAASDGVAPLKLAPTLLVEVMQRIRPEIEGKSAAKGLELRWIVPDILPRVMANPAKLAEILRKLADNAVKFTDNGFVEVRVESDGSDVLVSVRDSGPGIAHADQPRVYGRFEKLAQAQESPGAGVGLFIAKRLAERMKARLRLESMPGQGSVFFLILPVAE